MDAIGDSCLGTIHGVKKTFRFAECLFEFRDVESRQPPITRTDALVTLALLRVRHKRPFWGHKSTPLLWDWVGADRGRSIPDWMNDLKCFCEIILKIFAGSGSDGFCVGLGKQR